VGLWMDVRCKGGGWRVWKLDGCEMRWCGFASGVME
jgi:hypothetical protein